MKPSHLPVGLALALSIGSPPGFAAVVTFDGLSGATGDPFGPYTEAGFTVTPTLGDWQRFQAFGHPAPSIRIAHLGPGAPVGRLRITADGALFTFEALDLQVFYTGAHHRIQGARAGSPVFEQAGDVPAGGAFQTLTGTVPWVVDTLTIDIAANGSGVFSVDNLRLSAVPEPAAGLLWLSGLVGVVAMRRR